MGQVIKKSIAEKHSVERKLPRYKTLLVDGGALLMMAFKDESMNSKGYHIGGVVQFLVQLKMMLQKYRFEYVYVFFDDKYSGYLRWKEYNAYKANREKHYEEYEQEKSGEGEELSEYMKKFNENYKKMSAAIFGKQNAKKYANMEEKTVSAWQLMINMNFDRERDILMAMFEELYIRCYMDEVVEGDDLISYYCAHKEPNEDIVIMTGDVDIMQLITDEVSVYYLHDKIMVTPDVFREHFGYDHRNIALKKILCGDPSDNIGNIRGLSEMGLMNMMPEMKTEKVTIDDVRERARKLINERVESKKKPLQLHKNILDGKYTKVYEKDFYETNKRIIDLSEPIMRDEAVEMMDAMMHAPIDPEGRSMKNLYKIIVDYGIDNLSSDSRFSGFFSTFKKLEEIERKRFEASQA